MELSGNSFEKLPKRRPVLNICQKERSLSSSSVMILSDEKGASQENELSLRTLERSLLKSGRKKEGRRIKACEKDKRRKVKQIHRDGPR